MRNPLKTKKNTTPRGFAVSRVRRQKLAGGYG
jgi:hypothetical protein